MLFLHSVKQMMGPAPHTQLDAELAAGMGMPDNGPKLMAMWVFHWVLGWCWGRRVLFQVRINDLELVRIYAAIVLMVS